MNLARSRRSQVDWGYHLFWFGTNVNNKAWNVLVGCGGHDIDLFIILSGHIESKSHSLSPLILIQAHWWNPSNICTKAWWQMTTLMGDDQTRPHIWAKAHPDCILDFRHSKSEEMEMALEGNRSLMVLAIEPGGIPNYNIKSTFLLKVAGILSRPTIHFSSWC